MSVPFPILRDYHNPKRWAITSVPWAMVAHREARAKTNHGQTLARLAERGGLSPAEMILLLDNRDLTFAFMTPSDEEAAIDLAMRVDAFEKK